MTKISKKQAYPLKSPIKEDFFIGSDSQNLDKTVNFSFEDATKVINELNGSAVLNYRFETSYNIPLQVLEEGVFLSEANETTISNITKIHINKKNLDGTDLSQLFQFIGTNKTKFLMRLKGYNNPFNAFYLNIVNVTTFSDYFTIDVTVSIGNAFVTSLVHFNTYFIDFELKAGSGGGGETNLDYIASPTNGIVTSDTGLDATIPLADDTNAGLLTSDEKSKINTALQSLNIDGLTDVTITGTTANKILGSTTEGIWENKTIAQILGYTVENFANKQNSLTIDGTGVKYPTIDAVNAGLGLKSNIASPTFTGVITTPALTLSSTPTTSASTYDILTRNTSTGVTEKISSSGLGDMTLGTAQTVTALKTFTNTPSVTGGVTINNTNTNTSTGNGQLINSSGFIGLKVIGSGTYGIYSDGSFPTGINAVANNNTTAIRAYNQGTGSSIGFYSQNTNVGIGSYFRNDSSGINFKLENIAAATGDAFQYLKSGVIKAFINDAGDFSAQSITVLGTLGLRNVANTFTSLFTNTNTAARTYTLPNRDITFAGTDEVVLKTTDQNILGVKSFTNTNNSTSNGGLQFINNGSGSGKSIEMDNNSGGRAISLTNTSGVGFFGYNVSPNILYYCDNISVGDAANFRNNSSGRAIYIENKSTGKAIDIESTTASTGNILNITKNGTLVLKIDSNGELTVPKITMNGTVELKAYTVATLPTGVQGAVAYCTDLLAPTVMSTAVGGGSVKWKVFYDGTSWKVG